MTTRCSSSMRLSMLSLLGRWAAKASCPNQSDARHIILPYCSSCASTTILVRFSQAVDCRPMLTARWTIRSRPRTLQFVARRRPRPAADIISFQRAHVCRNAGHQGDSSRSHTTIWAPAPEPGVPPAHSERRSRSHRPMALKIRAGAELLTLTPQRSFAASKPRYAMTSGSGALSSRAA